MPKFKANSVKIIVFASSKPTCTKRSEHSCFRKHDIFDEGNHSDTSLI